MGVGGRTGEQSASGGTLVPGAGVADLVAVMDRLRSPGGCPWDAEQTHESLARYAVEEVYELLEAIASGDRDALVEELGDVLLQVVFHARLGQERPDPFDLDEVAAGVAAKLRHRHPHVFAGAEVDGSAGVAAAWEKIKAEEKSRTSVLDGIPPALPALARAQKVAGRAHRAGVLPTVGQSGEGEHDGAVTTGSAGLHGPEAELGDRLLALAFEAEALGVDAEGALRAAVRHYEARVRSAETTR